MRTPRSALFAIAALAIVTTTTLTAGCGPSVTAPDRRPVIDSISPSSDPPATIYGRLICVYGQHLRGGKVYFQSTPIASASPDDCPILFALPNGDPGLYSVVVETPAGFSNVTYFVRR